MICIDLIAQLFVVRPTGLDRFDGFFRRVVSLISGAVPFTIACNCFLTVYMLLSLSRQKFGSDQNYAYWSLFIETSAAHPSMRPVISRLALSTNLCDYPRTALARLILRNSPNQDDIWSVANFFFPQGGTHIEKPLSLL